MAIARAKNRKGEPGDPGQPGADAVQPQFAIGEVTSGTEAAVTLTGTKKKPILNFVLPKGKQGDPGKPGKPGEPGKNSRSSGSAIIAAPDTGGTTAPTHDTVPAGQTKVVHTLALADFFSLEYFFSIRKADLTKARTFKMVVGRTAAGLEDTIFARLGSAMNYSINANVNGSNAEIEITNNEAFDILTTFKFESLN